MGAVLKSECQRLSMIFPLCYAQFHSIHAYETTINFSHAVSGVFRRRMSIDSAPAG